VMTSPCLALPTDSLTHRQLTRSPSFTFDEGSRNPERHWEEEEEEDLHRGLAPPPVAE
jgi:hypothetical protein